VVAAVLPSPNKRVRLSATWSLPDSPHLYGGSGGILNSVDQTKFTTQHLGVNNSSSGTGESILYFLVSNLFSV